VLVPYPHATGDHQTANASWMADGGAALVVADAALTPERLRAEVDSITSDPQRLTAMASASARLARPNAARDVAQAVLAAANSSIR
jgi:UDP-N-acetylglucosamine--N-acetylmuramyl-(pentapeptide) pyrophosphoryl-undecaprenol N-acetylglucosamine transferase